MTISIDLDEFLELTKQALVTRAERATLTNATDAVTSLTEPQITILRAVTSEPPFSPTEWADAQQPCAELLSVLAGLVFSD